MDEHHFSYITKLGKKKKKSPAREALMARLYWNKGPEAEGWGLCTKVTLNSGRFSREALSSLEVALFFFTSGISTKIEMKKRKCEMNWFLEVSIV